MDHRFGVGALGFRALHGSVGCREYQAPSPNLNMLSGLNGAQFGFRVESSRFWGLDFRVLQFRVWGKRTLVGPPTGSLRKK